MTPKLRGGNAFRSSRRHPTKPISVIVGENECQWSEYKGESTVLGVRMYVYLYQGNPFHDLVHPEDAPYCTGGFLDGDRPCYFFQPLTSVG